MTETERLAAIEANRDLKAIYWRGVDSGDGALVRSILAEDCLPDFRGGCTEPTSAEAIWTFTDRIFYPPGMNYSRFTGYGYYHESYIRKESGWKLATTRITRLWVEAH